MNNHQLAKNQKRAGVCDLVRRRRLVIAPLALVFYHLIRNGASSVNWAFFTELPKPVGVVGGGMANAIVGSLRVAGLASLIGIPIGVLGGVYLAEYGSSTRQLDAAFHRRRFKRRAFDHLGCRRLRSGGVAIQRFLRVCRRPWPSA